MNQAEATAALGVSAATTSRLVSGQRTPGLHLVFRIEAQFRWSVASQLDAIRRGVYHIEFSDRMDRVAFRGASVD